MSFMVQLFSFIFIFSFVIIALVIIFVVITVVRKFTRFSPTEVTKTLKSQIETLKPKVVKCEYCGSILKETDSVCSACGAKRTSKD